MSLLTTIIPLEETHIKEAYLLFNKEFGEDYLSISYLKKYIQSNNHLGYCMVFDKKMVAIGLIDILSPTEMKEVILKEIEWFYNHTKNVKTVALIKQILVNPAFQNNGLGTELIQHFLSVFQKKADLIMSIAWKKRDSIPLKNLLLRNHFEAQKTIKNYWGEDSIEKEYNCAECGPPPCRCSAVVYSLTKFIN